MNKNLIIVFLVATLASSIIMADEIRPGVLRTPDNRFENLPGYDFKPNYLYTVSYTHLTLPTIREV